MRGADNHVRSGHPCVEPKAQSTHTSDGIHAHMFVCANIRTSCTFHYIHTQAYESCMCTYMYVRTCKHFDAPSRSFLITITRFACPRVDFDAMAGFWKVATSEFAEVYKRQALADTHTCTYRHTYKHTCIIRTCMAYICTYIHIHALRAPNICKHTRSMTRSSRMCW